MRHALPCVMLLAACSDAHTPPPYTMVLRDMPLEHQAIMRGAMQRWNAVVGHQVFTEQDQPGRDCGRVIVEMDPSDPSAVTYGGECNMRIVYRPEYADRCVFLHELGHVLGIREMDDDAPKGSVLRDCNGPVQDVTEREGKSVREQWGMDR